MECIHTRHIIGGTGGWQEGRGNLFKMRDCEIWERQIKKNAPGSNEEFVKVLGPCFPDRKEEDRRKTQLRLKIPFFLSKFEFNFSFPASQGDIGLEIPNCIFKGPPISIYLRVFPKSSAWINLKLKCKAYTSFPPFLPSRCVSARRRNPPPQQPHQRKNLFLLPKQKKSSS